MPDDVARALAGDVEYRLWDIIEVRPTLATDFQLDSGSLDAGVMQESIKFMRHSRRTKLKVDDIDSALKVRNLEPLWGFSSSASAAAAQPFKKTVTASGTVYHVEEQEIDLSKVIKTDVPSVPRDISFTGALLFLAVLRCRWRLAPMHLSRSTLARNRRRPTSNQGEPDTTR